MISDDDRRRSFPHGQIINNYDDVRLLPRICTEHIVVYVYLSIFLSLFNLGGEIYLYP